VSVIDLRTNSVVKNITVGLQPTAILAAGGHVYVANSNSDSVSVIDPATNRVVHTLRIQAFPGASFGSSPNGLAFTSREELAVSLGANNAVAFYRWSDRERQHEWARLQVDQWEYDSDRDQRDAGELVRRVRSHGLVSVVKVAVASAPTQPSGAQASLRAPDCRQHQRNGGRLVVPNSGSPEEHAHVRRQRLHRAAAG
jgi:YVTN family beta-propeller protein